MDIERTDERATFVAAFQMEPAAGRAACLRGACGGNTGLLTRVGAQLRAHGEIGDFLEPVSLNGEYENEGLHQ